MNQAGNFVPVIAITGTIAKGETPIVMRWDYLALADRDSSAGNPKPEIVIPKSGVFAGVYVQAISAYAPHPNAAKLWMEYLYSDEGQLHLAQGLLPPIRYNDMAARGRHPGGPGRQIARRQSSMRRPSSPAATNCRPPPRLITTQWDSVVKADVK